VIVDYVLHVVVMVAINATLALALSLIVDHMGVYSLCHAAFAAIGGYTTALLSADGSVSAALIGAGAGGLGGVAVGLLIRLLDRDQILLATLGIQLLTVSVINNLTSLTGGPGGISGLPPIAFGRGWSRYAATVVLALILMAISFGLTRRLTRGAFGRALHVMREDELLFSSYGGSITGVTVRTFALSAALAALAGSLYVHHYRYAGPGLFDLTESVAMLCIVIFGGYGRARNVLIAAVLLTLPREALRFVNLSGISAADIKQVIMSSLLLLMIAIRRRPFTRKS
jgi:branched-chain amino acid transport system permease protein